MEIIHSIINVKKPLFMSLSTQWQGSRWQNKMQLIIMITKYLAAFVPTNSLLKISVSVIWIPKKQFLNSLTMIIFMRYEKRRIFKGATFGLPQCMNLFPKDTYYFCDWSHLYWPQKKVSHASLWNKTLNTSVFKTCFFCKVPSCFI